LSRETTKITLTIDCYNYKAAQGGEIWC